MGFRVYPPDFSTEIAAAMLGSSHSRFFWEYLRKSLGNRSIPSSVLYLVGGDWNFMEFYDIPFSWECHHPNWRTPSFFRGVAQPPTRF